MVSNMGLVTILKEKYCFVADNGSALWWGDGYLDQEESGTFTHLSAEEDKLYFLYDQSAFFYDSASEEYNEVSFLNQLFEGRLECLLLTKDYYIVCCQNEDNDLNTVYRVSRADGKSIPCCQVSTSNKFTISNDGWLYYVAQEDNVSGIYRMRLDTLERAENRLIYMTGDNKEKFSFCCPVIKGEYLYCINYDTADLHNYKIVRMPRESGYDKDCPVWYVGAELQRNVEGWNDLYDGSGFALNVNRDKEEFYLTCMDSESGIPYLYQITGNEDGTIELKLTTEGAFTSSLSYYKNGNYRIWYMLFGKDENGAVNTGGDTDLYYREFDPDGNNVTNQ